MKWLLLFLIVLLCSANALDAGDLSQPWKWHVIDDSSRGADGVRLADINQDGRLDIATGWEEGGLIRVYLQPDKSSITNRWPAVTVGKVKSPEDAFFADVNFDGQLDVVSCCEGNEQSLFAHISPVNNKQLLSEKLWKTIPIQSSVKQTRWMFGQAVNLDAKFGNELLCGSKNPQGTISWFNWDKQGAIANAKRHPVCAAGWIMSLMMVDLDLDGDDDLVYSDRKGDHRGCWYRLNPGDNSDPATWTELLMGGKNREVMFLSPCDVNRDGKLDFVCPIRDQEFQLYINKTDQRSGDKSLAYEMISIPFPENVGSGKCAAIADVDMDGTLDLVATCGLAAKKHGAYWLSGDLLGSKELTLHPISGRELGAKFDLIELLDLDQDGDLDLLTCEERDNLGVIWYENPTR